MVRVFLCLSAVAALTLAAAGHSAPRQQTVTVRLAETPAGLPAYSRGDWAHWSDADGDCQDTRQEVLLAESRKPVKYKTKRRCVVRRGLWVGLYTGRKVRDPRNLDVDHMVPLAEAHRSGGWAWTVARKREFANSLGFKDHLIAVTKKANRAKGARPPDQWRPKRKRSWCRYATSWAKVKQKWGLAVTRAEASALREMLATCKRSVTLATEPWQHPQIPGAPEDPANVYPSCEEAEAAGEPLVQGTSGPGKGFPSQLVPSARDGDGDGVVCER